MIYYYYYYYYCNFIAQHYMKVQSIYSKTCILDNIIRVWLGIVRNTIKYIES